MTTVNGQSMITKWLAAALGSGFVAFVAAFVPSPLRVFDVFESAAKVEVREPPKLAMAEAPALEMFTEITARPIFNAARKPDPDARAAATPDAAGANVGADLSEFRLVGIVADSTTQRAIVERQGSASLHVAPGDSLGGWRIVKIDAAGITVTKDGRSVRVVIPKTQPRAPTP